MFVDFSKGDECQPASAGEHPFPEPDVAATRRARLLPRLSDLPIPDRVQIVPSIWGQQMIEMADHIGAYHTLLVHDRFGGQVLSIPLEEARNPLRRILGPDLSAEFTRIYGGTRGLQIAQAARALRHARRAGVLAAVRAKLISASEAAVVIGTSRSMVSYLINKTSEGVGVSPVGLPERREVVLLKLAADLATKALAAAGGADRASDLAASIQQLSEIDCDDLPTRAHGSANHD